MKDIHGYSKRPDQALDRVAKSSVVGDQDKPLIERFSVVLRVQRISTGRVAKYACHLKTMAETLPALTRSERGLGGATIVRWKSLCDGIKYDVENYKDVNNHENLTKLRVIGKSAHKLHQLAM